MDRPQVIVAFLVLKMTTHPVSANPLLKPNACPSCDEGYFLKTNCIITPSMKVGIQCEKCTNCSASDQRTLVACSRTADSVCGLKTTTSLPPTMEPTEAANEEADFGPNKWIVLTVLVGSLVLIILLSVFLTMLSCSSGSGTNTRVWI